MAHYLTPPKIALLAFAIFYLDGIFDWDATVSVVKFITARLLPENTGPAQSKVGAQIHTSLTLDDLKSLFEAVSSSAFQEHWEEFVNRLWAIDNIDQLFDFFHNLKELFVRRDTFRNQSEHREPTLVTKTSLIGIFLRRAMLEFERLNFHETVSLFQGFQSFREPTRAVRDSSKRTTTAHQDRSVAEQAEVDELTLGKVSEILTQASERSEADFESVSSSDLERLLRFQVEQMQSKLIGTS